jgi:radical SAM protein
MLARNVFADAPARVYWEITRACALACRHCRAEAAPFASPNELDHATSLRVIAQLAAADPKPHLVLTGGDPFERADLFELIDAARAAGLAVSVSPSATPRLTSAMVASLKGAGVDAISLSLDGSRAASHDAIRRVPGCFDRTLRAAAAARQVSLPFQVNSLVSAETIDDLPAIEALARAIGAARWSLFFLITVGRGSVLQPIDAARAESLLRWLAVRARDPGMILTTTEAPHYRRVVAELHKSSGDADDERRRRAPQGHAAGIRDGNGILFIGHDGAVTPSGFLPKVAGNVGDTDPITIYRESPMFIALRDADRFSGRCGRCEHRYACGGSRARAWAASGDWLGEDPLCLHRPHVDGVTTARAGTTPSAPPRS